MARTGTSVVAAAGCPLILRSTCAVRSMHSRGSACVAARLVALLLCTSLLAACFAAPIDASKLNRRQISSLPAPNEPLSKFTDFELLPFDQTTAVQDDAAKLKAAAELESRLKARLAPLFTRWHEYNASEKKRRTLVIAPVLNRLRVVGAANRVFSGDYAGDSFIELDLQLRNGPDGESIGVVPLRIRADATKATLTMGSADRSLIDDVVEVTYKYLTDNYWPK